MRDEKQLVQDIVRCSDYSEALENMDHPCWKTVRHSVFKGKQLTPEAWRFSEGCSSLDEVESLLLGWNPGIGANTHAPLFSDSLQTKIGYSYRKLEKSHNTLYKNALEHVIDVLKQQNGRSISLASPYRFAKTNLAHCKANDGRKNCSDSCVEHCADKHLKGILGSCEALKLIVLYDGRDYFNKRFELSASPKRPDDIPIVYAPRVRMGPNPHGNVSFIGFMPRLSEAC